MNIPRLTHNDLTMGLIRTTLVIVAFSNCLAASDLSSSTDVTLTAPSVESTEFDRRPLVVHYSVDTSRSVANSTAEENTTPTLNENYTSSTQLVPEVTQEREVSTLAAITTTTFAPSVEPTTTAMNQPSMASYSPQPYCTLGDDTFQIGERWNPNLPPFGVQVCVLCECTIRPRKNCYESKVTCRRITNECPVIDSCPDGKKPITVAGQCCKSCQSASLSSVTQQDSNSQAQQQHTQIQMLGNQSPAYESQTAKGDQQQQHQTPVKIVYMNERTKDYMSMVKNLPACPIKDSETRPTASSVPSTLTSGLPVAPKAPKGGRNDLNGIDTRLAFKSLHDSATNYLMPSKSFRDESNKRLEHSSADDHHQHPNDVQSAYSSNSNSNNNINQQTSYGRTKQYNSSPNAPNQASSHNCMLGNDTFQVGDVWSPILPPLGVQVCVQCNCLFRVRKSCYETKLVCRRINKDCPVVDTCPDGKPPVTVSGQCCKSCPTLMNSIEQQPMNLMNEASSSSIPPYLTLDGIQRNEKVYHEFQAISRNMNICIRTRESVDIYSNSNNRYARRSRRT